MRHQHHFYMGRHRHGGPFGGGSGFMGRFGGFMGGGQGFRAARMLASGDLQLIVLALLKEKSRHGYEIIKELEQRSSSMYTPSPGVVYPALTYLEEAGFAVSQTEGNKKQYQITEAGLSHLEKNAEIVSETLKQLELFGRKMARVREHFADEEAENEMYDAEPKSRAQKAEWREMKMEFRAIKDELKAILREKIFASKEEKQRILEILKKAIREMQGK